MSSTIRSGIFIDELLSEAMKRAAELVEHYGNEGICDVVVSRTPIGSKPAGSWMVTVYYEWHFQQSVVQP